MKKYLFALTIFLALLLITACSEMTTPVGPTQNQTSDSFEYPPSDDALYQLPAGTEMIGMFEESALDNHGQGGGRGCGPVSYSQFVRAQFGATLNNGRGVMIVIEPNEMPYDATITITNPQRCYAIYDFYPHPFQFNDYVEVRWFLSQFILPEGIEWEDLQCWYLNDHGQYVPVSWELSQNGQFFYLWTNHFSRYIITAPSGG